MDLILPGWDGAVESGVDPSRRARYDSHQNLVERGSAHWHPIRIERCWWWDTALY
jgi:hypothetical protein